MGSSFSRLWDRLFGEQEISILMVGFDNVGKTTILNKLRLGDVYSENPYENYHIETVKYRNIMFKAWDLDIHEKPVPIWNEFYETAHAIIFVVDSTHLDSVHQDKTAQQELHELLNTPSLQRLPFLVLANKQDLPKALQPAQITEHLALTKLPPRQPWCVQPCCGTTGEGLHQGLDWLTTSMLR
eukprot:TRINITY_DN7161_c0_g1_i3.p1 TRINITY_DN7161_c0_g1~~TRINITY_DN7161_c0_g1_i3.p1  ORF type:complete len:184 (+),score=23.90 TRINITY_DN7161_c0_g1_i3:97-648(+)